MPVRHKRLGHRQRQALTWYMRSRFSKEDWDETRRKILDIATHEYKYRYNMSVHRIREIRAGMARCMEARIQYLEAERKESLYTRNIIM